MRESISFVIQNINVKVSNAIVSSTPLVEKRERKVIPQISLTLLINLLLPDVLTDLHYKDLMKFEATSVAMSKKEKNLCTKNICENEVIPNKESICGNAPIEKDCKATLQCKDMCSCWVTANCAVLKTEVKGGDYGDDAVSVEENSGEELVDEKVEEERGLDIQNAVSTYIVIYYLLYFI